MCTWLLPNLKMKIQVVSSINSVSLKSRTNTTFKRDLLCTTEELLKRLVGTKLLENADKKLVSLIANYPALQT